MTLKRVALNAWAYALDVSPLGHLIAISTQNRLLSIVDYEQGTFQDYVAHRYG